MSGKMDGLDIAYALDAVRIQATDVLKRIEKLAYKLDLEYRRENGWHGDGETAEADNRIGTGTRDQRG